MQPEIRMTKLQDWIQSWGDDLVCMQGSVEISEILTYRSIIRIFLN